MQTITRKPLKYKRMGRGGMRTKHRGGNAANRPGAAGVNIARKAERPTMRATDGGLVLMTKDGARGKPTVQTSARSRRKTMSNGNENGQTLAAVGVRERVASIARHIMANEPEAREAFAATGAVLLTVILDDGEKDAEWELDAGDWVLVRVSDYADMKGRGQGDLFPVTP